jgi:hypothetical protein
MFTRVRKLACRSYSTIKISKTIFKPTSRYLCSYSSTPRALDLWQERIFCRDQANILYSDMKYRCRSSKLSTQNSAFLNLFLPSSSKVSSRVFRDITKTMNIKIYVVIYGTSRGYILASIMDGSWLSRLVRKNPIHTRNVWWTRDSLPLKQALCLIQSWLSVSEYPDHHCWKTNC